MPRHRVVKAIAITLAAVLVVVLTGGFFVYRHLNNNITGIDITSALGTDRPTEVKQKTPQKPLNILLLGSDTRQGQTGHIGGDTPGLSDTTILLHISGDRKLALRRQPARATRWSSGPRASARTARAPTPAG